jgi:hypothetical protein
MASRSRSICATVVVLLPMSQLGGGADATDGQLLLDPEVRRGLGGRGVARDEQHGGPILGCLGNLHRIIVARRMRAGNVELIE